MSKIEAFLIAATAVVIGLGGAGVASIRFRQPGTSVAVQPAETPLTQLAGLQPYRVAESKTVDLNKEPAGAFIKRLYKNATAACAQDKIDVSLTDPVATAADHVAMTVDTSKLSWQMGPDKAFVLDGTGAVSGQPVRTMIFARVAMYAAKLCAAPPTP